MKINYINDDVSTIAEHFVNCSRQVVSLAVRRYEEDTTVYNKLNKAVVLAKIIKLEAELATLP